MYSSIKRQTDVLFPQKIDIAMLVWPVVREVLDIELEYTHRAPEIRKLKSYYLKM